LTLILVSTALLGAATVSGLAHNDLTQAQSSEFDCTSKADGFHPSPYSCSDYYVCAANVAFKTSCHPGLVFNSQTLYCDFKEYVTCGSTIPAPVTQAPVGQPTTMAPVTQAPVVTTKAPVVTTKAPVTQAPTTPAPVTQAPASTEKFRRVCYYSGWAVSRPAPNNLQPGDIDVNLCTHVIYSFATLDGTGTQLQAMSGEEKLFAPFTSLKQKNPNLKTMIAVGGWNMASGPFTKAVRTTASMRAFANNAVTFLRSHNFDGLDIDWEYPAARGSGPGDKAKFVQWLQIIREAFDNEPNRGSKDKLLLTVAVGVPTSRVQESYDVAGINRNVDFINLMMYDLHGSWEAGVNHHAPLYSNDGINVDAYIKYWAAQGAAKDKLVMGTPFYAKTYNLANAGNTAIGAPHAGGGTMVYYEICKALKNGGIQEHMLPKQRVPYAVINGKWAGYDNVQSLTEKANYVRDNGYGGVMTWAIDLDDTTNQCGQGKYPLMNALKNGLL